MDFHVFYCNLVNILIHFFFFPLLVCRTSLIWLETGKGGGLKYTHPSLWQYSSVTAVFAQQTTQLGEFTT